MGEAREPPPAKFFVGILTALPTSLSPLLRSLEERFGPVDSESDLLDFTYTDYYKPEMGPGLKRKFWGFGRLAGPDALVDFKLFTNGVEQTLSVGGKRTVNVDPGYLTAARIVLASTKDFAHRIYLGRGIYGEVTLLYQKKNFRPLPWTYPDYRSEGYLQYFRRLRRDYMMQLASPENMPSGSGSSTRWAGAVFPPVRE